MLYEESGRFRFDFEIFKYLEDGCLFVIYINGPMPLKKNELWCTMYATFLA